MEEVNIRNLNKLFKSKGLKKSFETRGRNGIGGNIVRGFKVEREKDFDNSFTGRLLIFQENGTRKTSDNEGSLEGLSKILKENNINFNFEGSSFKRIVIN